MTCSHCLAELNDENYTPGAYRDVGGHPVFAYGLQAGKQALQRLYYCRTCWALLEEAERQEKERRRANRLGCFWLCAVPVVVFAVLAWLLR